MASSGSLPDFTEIFCLNKVPKTVKTLHSFKKNTAVHSAFRPFSQIFYQQFRGQFQFSSQSHFLIKNQGAKTGQVTLLFDHISINTYFYKRKSLRSFS
jgi:hypothetical protein